MKLTTSKRLAQALADININTSQDVVRLVPYRYDDYRISESFPHHHGQRLVMLGVATSAPTFARSAHYQIVTFSFKSQSQRQYKVVAFNRPYLRSIIKLGTTYTIIGIYDHYKYAVNLVTVRQGALAPHEVIKPVYQLSNRIDQHVYHNLLKRVFDEGIKSISDDVPKTLTDKYKLLTKADALKKLHFPLSFDDVQAGLRVYKYEEALKFSIKTQLIRQSNKYLHKNVRTMIDVVKINDFVTTLPFKLSTEQTNAMRQIILDMNSEQLMYRLLQGDVGSGKTVVAAIALYGNYLRNDQGALMAPTDALAKQHFVTLTRLFKNTGIRCGLLVGGLSAREKSNVKEALLDGLVDVVIGTHALFSEDVIYQSLGLAIIDEQHRFGVSQRSLLSNKGASADLLLLSATPIPRTLALTLFGDMDITTIKQFPFTKREVQTSIHPPDDQTIDELIHQSLIQKRQIFIIAPLIDETESSFYAAETLFDMYESKYPGQVGLLHGRLSGPDKDDTLSNFYSKRKPILVSTTVIEVGLDVPTANLMIVYDAHRFGLASLHQLRGRIGRDGTSARFLLISELDNPQEHARLQVLLQSNDGFYIAEQDLATRGPGELVGTRQAGLPSFSYINVYKDFKMLEYARRDAQMLLSQDDIEAQKFIEITKTQLDTMIYG